MSELLLPLAFACGATISAALTGLVRRYAISNAVLDFPNERSSHARPTPRGGGAAIVLTTLACVGAAYLYGAVGGRLTFALAGGGLLVAGVGWLDDHRSVTPGLRVVVQVVGALWALYWLRGLPVVRLGSVEFVLGSFGWVLGTAGIVWSTNLFNFMDGIDGIAGGEAVSVGCGAAILAALAGTGEIMVTAGFLAASSIGFLMWNWPPARIFMGDVGSGFLGYAFGVLAVASENVGGPPLLAWIVLLGVFVVDATVSLVRRMWRGDRWLSAHRTHAYQRAVQTGFSHAKVAGTTVALNLLLFPLAVAATQWDRLTLPAVALALVLLLGVYAFVERLNPMSGSGG